MLVKISLSHRLANAFFLACIKKGPAFQKKIDLYSKTFSLRHNIRSPRFRSKEIPVVINKLKKNNIT